MPNSGPIRESFETVLEALLLLGSLDCASSAAILCVSIAESIRLETIMIVTTYRIVVALRSCNLFQTTRTAFEIVDLV